jgi:outer membrane protein assembly factor BamD (BamD/ComL family)
MMFISIHNVNADLSSPLYTQAKDKYDNGDYVKALELLDKYKLIDKKYLQNNVETLKSIDDAIAYCKIKTSKEFVGRGVGEWEPKLPVASPE